MSLTQALGTALGGLRASQAGLSLVSANVANAQTPGYVRKSLGQEAAITGDYGIGVRVTAVNRELDGFIQKQLQVETSGGAYADLRAELYQRLQQVYGQPGADSSLETAFNNFTAALQALTTSPDASAARSTTLSAAQSLAQQLNTMSDGIQQIRSDAELGIADAVQQANEAMRTIARINQQLSSASAGDATTATLLDQRDAAVAQLSELLDVRVVASDQNQVSVFTNSGIQLVGLQPSVLSFDAAGTLSASSQWSADPAQRSVGTISLVTGSGHDIDLVAANAIRSGKIAAYLEMRDRVLPEAQAQLDALAAAMASALSDRTSQGTPAVSGTQTGFDIDAANVLPGNRIEIAYADNVTGTTHNITIIRVDDPAALPLKDTATTTPGDKVIGVSFAAGMNAVAAALNAALGATGLQFSNTSGSTLRVLDDGTANRIDITSAAAVTTAATLTGGSAELPFFVDGNNLYTGEITASQPQSVGLAARIGINRALLADPTRLTIYRTSPANPAGDGTRPDFLYAQLTQAGLSFLPSGGIGTTTAPFTGTVSSYLRQLISQQGEAAAAADNLKQGQDVVVNSLRQRLDASASVDIDTEMANLLSLQTAYGANARIMTSVRELLDLLMKM